jgi:hypothetical protein
LELIEWVGADCTAADGPWHSDAEIKLDATGFIIKAGKKDQDLLGCHARLPVSPQAHQNPLHHRRRNHSPRPASSKASQAQVMKKGETILKMTFESSWSMTPRKPTVLFARRRPLFRAIHSG